jgi:hypothetical protein
LIRLLALSWALAAPAGAAEGPSFGAGASGAAGSGGYWRFATSGDAQWTAQPWLPFAWTELGFNRYATRISLGGGSWRELDADVRAKGGLSYSVGRFRDSDDASHAVTLETGAERILQDGVPGAGSTVGTEYLLTFGSLGGGRTSTSLERNRGGQVRRARGAAQDAPSFTDHTLAVYGRAPASDTEIGLRVALDLPSDAPDVVSETLSWRVPIRPDLWVTPALTLEQGETDGVIASVGLYRVF